MMPVNSTTEPGQPCVMISGIIFAKPDEYPGRQESQLRERISDRTPRSDQQEGD
jgi:hypothetical protein